MHKSQLSKWSCYWWKEVTVITSCFLCTMKFSVEVRFRTYFGVCSFRSQGPHNTCTVSIHKVLFFSDVHTVWTLLRVHHAGQMYVFHLLQVCHCFWGECGCFPRLFHVLINLYCFSQDGTFSGSETFSLFRGSELYMCAQQTCLTGFTIGLFFFIVHQLLEFALLLGIKLWSVRFLFLTQVTVPGFPLHQTPSSSFRHPPMMHRRKTSGFLTSQLIPTNTMISLSPIQMWWNNCWNAWHSTIPRQYLCAFLQTAFRPAQGFMGEFGDHGNDS